jgi:hypothetical protein
MAITFVWNAHDGSGWNLSIGSTNVFGFYGSGGYGSPIQVGQYNSAMHIRTSTADDTDACSVPHLTNIKYMDNTTVSIAGGSPVALTSAVNTNLLRLQVQSDVNIAVIGTRLYSYDGVNVDNPPANVTFKAFKLSDTTWSTPSGRANSLSLGTSTTPATTHNFYFAMSLSPISTGASTLFVLRVEVDVQ